MAGLLSRPSIDAKLGHGSGACQQRGLASGKHGTLYVGVTASLLRRIHEHREGATPGFTSRYGVTRLGWYRRCSTVVEAIGWEKRLKKYKRDWKVALIEQHNPNWDDLFPGLL